MSSEGQQPDRRNRNTSGQELPPGMISYNEPTVRGARWWRLGRRRETGDVSTQQVHHTAGSNPPEFQPSLGRLTRHERKAKRRLEEMAQQETQPAGVTSSAQPVQERTTLFERWAARREVSRRIKEARRLAVHIHHLDNLITVLEKQVTDTNSSWAKKRLAVVDGQYEAAYDAFEETGEALAELGVNIKSLFYKNKNPDDKKAEESE